MIAVIQRVKNANVKVDNVIISEIEHGYLILLGVENGDTDKDIEKLSNKIVNLRIFEDDNEKMNLSLLDVQGSALIVSQFTLLANCVHGRRPDFLNAAKPDTAIPFYEKFCIRIKELGVTNVKTGKFGADMKVSLLNDGPVTIILNSKDLK